MGVVPAAHAPALMSRTDPELPQLPGWDLLTSWVAVVETGSITTAAKRLAVSQAGVSQHVKQLELLYATELLDRTTRPARPTASGQRLFDHATELLRMGSAMSESVRQLSRAKRSVVRLGCIDSFAATIGPQLLRGLQGTLHKVRLSSGLSPSLNEQFANRQLDLLVTTSELLGLALVQRLPILTERYCVALPASLPAPRLGTLREMSQTLQLLRYSARSVMGAHIESFLQSTDPGLPRQLDFDATDPLLALVSAGLGFAITTPLCIWQSRHFIDELRIVPLTAFTRGGKPYPALARTCYLTYREGELGALPHETHEVLRVAARGVAAQVVARLGIEAGDVVVHQAMR